MPGSISTYLSVPSINNIAKTMIPMLAYFQLKNKTFDIGYEQSSWLYDLNVKDIHVEEATF